MLADVFDFVSLSETNPIWNQIGSCCVGSGAWNWVRYGSSAMRDPRKNQVYDRVVPVG
jgi:hypothetical protein